MGRFLDSTLGRKVVMALTGVLLVGFVLAHLGGNLTLYADKDGAKFVDYAQKLKDFGPLLWVAEVGLVALFGLHVAMAFRLSAKNREARPDRYVVKRTFGESNLASRSMLITGSVVLGFLVVHLANFRFSEGLAPPKADSLFGTVTDTLRNPIWGGIYVLGALALGVHLAHGFRSLFQSFGAWHPKINRAARALGIGLAILIALGFASFPIAALFGFWKGDAS